MAMLAGIPNKRFLAGDLSDFLDFFLNIRSRACGVESEKVIDSALAGWIQGPCLMFFLSVSVWDSAGSHSPVGSYR